MKRIVVLTLVMCLVSPIAWAEKRVPVGQPTPCPTGPGWINLLDDEHALDWKVPDGAGGVFEIKDGILHIRGNRPARYIGYMKERFADFQLHVEFRVTEKANSGVLFRAKPEDPPFTGLEVQVLEDYGKEPDKHSCGSIFDVVTPMFNMSRPAGQWNSYDITVKGQHIVVNMNGWKIIDVDLSKMTKPIGKFDTPYAELPLDGYLFVQDHGFELWYRNIVIKKI